jgi:hypothetical protein
MKLVPRLIVSVIGIFVYGLWEGKFIHPREVWVDPAGETVFVTGSTCTVVVDRPGSEADRQAYVKRLEWCASAYNKAYPK